MNGIKHFHSHRRHLAKRGWVL